MEDSTAPSKAEGEGRGKDEQREEVSAKERSGSVGKPKIGFGLLGKRVAPMGITMKLKSQVSLP